MTHDQLHTGQFKTVEDANEYIGILRRNHAELLGRRNEQIVLLQRALADADGQCLAPTEDTTLNVLACVIENRHGTLPGIGDTLREALAELNRGSTDGF